MPSATFTASSSWTVPAGVTSVRLQAWGESGTAGHGQTGAGGFSGGGAGGGEYAEEPALAVTPGAVISFTIGAGGTSTNTVFAGASVTVTANHGGNGFNTTRGAGGTGSANTIHFAGGQGGNGNTATDPAGAGGGGSGGPTGAGGAGTTGSVNVPGGAGGAAGSGGGAGAGGQGGSGAVLNVPGFAGNAPGGGPGGGSGRTGGIAAGTPAAGKIIITWSAAPITAAMALTGVGAFTGAGRVAGTILGAAGMSGVGTFTAGSGISGGGVVNQWALSYSQPGTFQTPLPALQSAAIGLNPSYQVAPGSGVPTSGNWLFAIAGWNQNGLAPVTIGAADDIHSFWRPGQVVTATVPGSPSGVPGVSPAAGNSRTAIWYTPNIARAPQWVYVAPDGEMAALSVLVIEVSGLSPWDTVTGVYSSFADAATALTLTLGAPSATGYFVGAVTGDNTAAGQSFHPSGWLPLAVVSTTNGVDHTCDAELTAAVFTTSGSISASASASTAENLSGVVIGVLASGPSPIPGSGSVPWPSGGPGRTIFEAAFGSGYETPPDECVWTTLSDSEWPGTWQGNSTQFKRFWGWKDQSGIPWGLGQYQSSSGGVLCDNWDGWLSPSFAGSGFYSSALNANMSFQTGVGSWTAQNGAAIAQSSAQAYASAAQAQPQSSMQVTPNGSTATPGAHAERDAVAASTAYTASAAFYSVAGYSTGAQVAITWYTSGGTLISTSTSTATAIPAATWTPVSLTATSPSNAAFAAITVQFSGTPSATAFWVAEAALALGSSPVQTGQVTAGTPVRVRFALGTVGGTVYDRWYVWQRNMQSWPETRNKWLRNLVQASTTDAWQSATGACPTPYRGEIEQDNPVDWWPADDQPLTGGVQPTSLQNAANGSSVLMNIIASPSGVSAANAYSTTGTNLTSTGTSSTKPPLPSVATAQVGQQQGWNYGDPQSSPQAAQSGNPTTANPGAAAWAQTGLLGNTGTQTWFLAANDPDFPPLSGGATVKGWFQAGLAGSSTGYTTPGLSRYCVAAQPYSQITIATLSTGSAPVAVLYLDTSGHLILETFVGTTGTTHSVYSSSDLRNGAWMAVDILLTTTTWRVLVNGGLTASASGTMSAATSAWTWLTLNGDYGTAGGSSPSSIQHGGNVAYSQWAVFAGTLPTWRLQAHYAAAITAFGLLPAPRSLQLSAVANQQGGTSYTPDGTEFSGSYGSSGGSSSAYAMSAVAVAQAGPYTSGPAARTVSAGYGTDNGGVFYGDAVWLGLTALAPSVVVYTAASADAETGAATICGTGDSFTSGYGSGASGHGVCQTAAGSGTSPPTSASALGDTVQSRIERIFGYGGLTAPMRAIDPASNLVQAAVDVGGQQTGANIQNIVGSDGGWFFYDLVGVANYRQRSHLNADAVVWNIGMNTGAGQIPFAGDITWDNDPQRVYTDITVNPYSPDGSTLPELVPAAATAVDAAETQYGPRPLPVNSYLQSSGEQQNQANWLFTYYGTLRRRAAVITIDAATYPQAWPLVLSANIGDLIQVYDAPIGQVATTWTYRISQATRQLSFGANGQPATAQIQIVADPVIPFWS